MAAVQRGGALRQPGSAAAACSSLLRAPRKCHPCACALAGIQARAQTNPNLPPSPAPLRAHLGWATAQQPSSPPLLRTSFTIAFNPCSPAGPSLAGPRRQSWVCSPSCWRAWRTLVHRQRSPAGEQCGLFSSDPGSQHCGSGGRAGAVPRSPCPWFGEQGGLHSSGLPMPLVQAGKQGTVLLAFPAKHASACMQLGCVFAAAAAAAAPAPAVIPPSLAHLFANHLCRRILPLNQICAATIRQVDIMLADYQSAAGVAATAADVAAAAWRDSPADSPAKPGVPPAAVAVQLDSEANGFGVGAAAGKLPPPAVVAVRRHSSGQQQGGGRAGNGSGNGSGSGSGSGWLRAGDTGTAAAAAAEDSPRWPAVELSGHSGLPTPSTARPLSPDPSDSFASA